MALLTSAGKWRYVANNTRVLTAVNNSGGALTAGTLVKYASGAMAACGDSNTDGAHGVLIDDVASGAKGSLYLDGEFMAGVSGSIDFAIDDPLYTTTSGLVDQGTANDIEVARVAPYEDPSSGASEVRALLRSKFIHRALLTHA